MEKPPSVVNVENEQSKEKEKNSWAWETLRGIALGSMLGVGIAGGAEAVREIMKPQIDASEVTDNYHKGKWKPGETVKQFISLRVGDNAYRTEIDSGIKIEDYTGGPIGAQTKPEGIFNHVESMVTEVDGKDGTKMLVKFKVIPEGIQIHYQQIDSHGKVLNEQTSLLSPQIPSVER